MFFRGGEKIRRPANNLRRRRWRQVEQVFGTVLISDESRHHLLRARIAADQPVNVFHHIHRQSGWRGFRSVFICVHLWLVFPAVAGGHQLLEPPLLFPPAMRLAATDRPAMHHAEQPEPKFVNFANHSFLSFLPLRSGERVGVR